MEKNPSGGMSEFRDPACEIVTFSLIVRRNETHCFYSLSRWTLRRSWWVLFCPPAKPMHAVCSQFLDMHHRWMYNLCVTTALVSFSPPFLQKNKREELVSVKLLPQKWTLVRWEDPYRRVGAKLNGNPVFFPHVSRWTHCRAGWVTVITHTQW